MKYLLALIVLCLFIACFRKESNKELLLPNLETLNLNDNKLLFEKHEISFFQYDGFKGKYNDDILNEFNLIFKSSRIKSKVGSGKLKDEEIEKLKDEKFTGIRFRKIPSDEVAFEDLVSYLLLKYPNSKRMSQKSKSKMIDKEIILVDRSEDKVYCIIQFVELGIPGSFVIIN